MVTNEHELYNISKILLENSLGAVMTRRSNLINIKTMFAGAYTWKVLPGRFMSATVAMAFKPFHLFYDPIDELIGEIIPTGLLEFWSRFHFRSRFNVPRQSKEGPKVLTLERLSMGFAG